MSETEPPKPPWLQFRLAAAVLLMFVSGGVIWANVAFPFFPPGINTTAIYLSVITLCGSYERYSRGHVKNTQVLAGWNRIVTRLVGRLACRHADRGPEGRSDGREKMAGGAGGDTMWNLLPMYYSTILLA